MTASGGRAIVQTDPTLRPDIVIGDTRLSPSARRIIGPGGESAVEPRVMQVLLALIDADGRVVGRETLFATCWPGVIVGEDSLNRVIAEIRRLSRSVAEESFQVETIPRTGYRLQRTDDSAATPRPLARRAVVGGGVALAGVGAIGWWVGSRDRRDPRVRALVAESDQLLRSGLPGSEPRAAALLEQATTIDPADAEAWGKLALTRTALTEHGADDMRTEVAVGAQDAARRALALRPGQPDAAGAMAILPPYFGVWQPAERRMRAVIATNPDHLPTRDALAFMLNAVGRAREGSTDRLAIAAADPLHSKYQMMLIYAHWMLGDVDAVDRAADRAIQLWPGHPGIWFARLYTLLLTGRAPRAVAFVSEADRPELPPWLLDGVAVAASAIASKRAADRERAASLLIEQVGRGPSLVVNTMMLLVGLGEIDRAFALAHAYYLEDGPLIASVRWTKGQVSVDESRRRKTHMLFVPSAAPLRDDPRFMPLVERMGLADYWARTKPADFLAG